MLLKTMLDVKQLPEKAYKYRQVSISDLSLVKTHCVLFSRYPLVRTFIVFYSCLLWDTFRAQTPLQKAFIAQARMFLERRYYDYVAASVSNNLYQAQQGGIPGTFNLIRSFLNLRHLEGTPGLDDGKVAGHPTWAMLYYCLRCGDLEAAGEVIRNAK